MAKFYVNTDKLANDSSRISDVAKAAKTAELKVAAVANGLSGIGLGQLIGVMQALENKLSRQCDVCTTLSNTLSQIALKYIATESAIMGIPLFLNPQFQNVTDSLLHNALNMNEINRLDQATDFLEFTQYVGSPLGDFLNPDGTSKSFGEMMSGHEIGYEYKIWEAECSDDPDKKTWVDKYRREWNGKSHDDYKANYEDKVREASNNFSHNFAEASVSLFEGEASGSYGILSGDASYGFLNADASAGAFCGLFNDEGKFAPGLGLEASASASVFTAEANGLIGNDYLGVYGKAGVDVLKAEASATLGIGLVDAEGHFKPSCGLGLEAEAIAAQANGSVGGRILGTDVGVNGSIGFGAGAHLNVGLVDGKFSVDVGAYLGVGASLGFELDFNDTIETVEKAWNGLCDNWDGICDVASDAWDGVCDVASDAWDGVCDVASDAWDGVCDVASDAWDGACNVASDAWEGVCDFFSW